MDCSACVCVWCAGHTPGAGDGLLLPTVGQLLLVFL
jgi:hypothetical protein